MGLDQYAYAAATAATDVGAARDAASFQEIAYWRKHPHLQGWMEHLWREKVESRECVPPGPAIGEADIEFNGIELELTWEDLDDLEHAVRNKLLFKAHGPFFGEGRSDYYQDQDLEFIKRARTELFMGLRVFYNSSW